MRTGAFWAASAVIFLDEIVYLALIPLLPYYGDRFELTKTEAGLIVSAYPLLVLATSVPAGILCDRLGARALMISGTTLLVLATVGFAYADSAWQLFASRALQGLGSGPTAIAGMAIVAGAVPAARRATAISLAVALQGASTVAGPALGGYGVAALGVQTALLIPAALGVAVIVISVRLIPPHRRVPGSAPGALFALVKDDGMRAATACMLSIGVWGGAVYTLGPLRLGEAGYSASQLGTVFAAAALFGLLFTPAVGALADARGTAHTMLGWSIVVCALLVALAFPWRALVVAVLLAALVPLVRVGGALAYASGAEHSGVGTGLGTGFGVAVGAWSVGAVVGPVGAGAIADRAGYAAAFIAAALVCALLAVPLATPSRAAAGKGR